MVLSNPAVIRSASRRFELEVVGSPWVRGDATLMDLPPLEFLAVRLRGFAADPGGRSRPTRRDGQALDSLVQRPSDPRGWLSGGEGRGGGWSIPRSAGVRRMHGVELAGTLGLLEAGSDEMTFSRRQPPSRPRRSREAPRASATRLPGTSPPVRRQPGPGGDPRISGPVRGRHPSSGHEGQDTQERQEMSSPSLTY